MRRVRRSFTRSWLWWASVIVLLLRVADVDATSALARVKRPRTPEELGVPQCSSDYDCVSKGGCLKDADGIGRCMCPSSCPHFIPIGCRSSPRGEKPPCLLMEEEYRNEYKFQDPSCHKDVCVCPPMFEPWKTPKNFPIPELLPRKCDKRELNVTGHVVPSTTIYKGSDVKVYCCLNMDPTGIVDHSGVVLIHNNSVSKDPTMHPYQHEFGYDFVTDSPCWTLEIKNVQFSDSGTYMCIASYAQTSLKLPSVNCSVEFEVKPSKKLRNFNITTTANQATVQWDVEDGALKLDLRLTSHLPNAQDSWNVTNAENPTIIENLKPATMYTLHITVHGGPDVVHMTEHFQTQEKPPFPPGSQTLRLVEDLDGKFFCEVDWRAPDVSNGRITGYYVRMEGKVRDASSGFLVPDHYPGATHPRCANFDQDENINNRVNPVEFEAPNFYVCRYGPLKPNRNYSVTIWAANSAGRSLPLIYAEQCSTKYDAPDTIDQPKSLPPVNDSFFELRFDSPPDQTNGPITCYYLAVIPLLQNASVDKLPQPAELSIDTGSNALRNNLKPPNANEQKSYVAYIAESYHKILPPHAIIGDGNITERVPICPAKYLGRHSSEDIPLRQGLLYTGFLIARVDNENKRRPNDIVATTTAGALVRVEQTTTTPATTIITSPAYQYSSYFKPVIMNSAQNGFQTSSSWGIAVSVVLMLLFVVALAAVLATLYMRRKKKCLGEHIPLKSSVYGPVKAEDIAGEYRTRHKDTDFLFSEEWARIPNYNYDATASMRKENNAKNRYNDIRAFDVTRVKLKKLEGFENSDYINANYIRAYKPTKRFIAAQGPLQTTVEDFWRMCWEQNVEMIVMVANLTEKHKQQCAKYWPDEEPLILPRFDIVPSGAAEYYADYAIRSFDIIPKIGSGRLSPINITINNTRSVVDIDTIDNNSSEYPNYSNGVITNSRHSLISRRITQFHFTNWNDHKAPECSIGLLRFLHLLRSRPEFWSTQVVVHCSAGVGRTGTLIAIDSMMDMYLEKKEINVFKFVSEMREQRNVMVQSQDQYTFIYKVLAEWHLFGHTDFEEDEFVEHYRKLRHGGKSVRSGFEAEFKMLREELEPRGTTRFADEAANIMKNRQPRAVPYDRNRVCLQPCIGFSDSGYINASTVRGYFYPYILAQDPLCASTAFDIWRLFDERCVGTVVMLSDESLFAPSEKYWPESVDAPRVLSRDGHAFSIRLLAEERSSFFYTRKMEYTFQSEPPRPIVQFCYADWPSGSSTPLSSESLLVLIGRVLERQSHNPNAGPIVLMCRNGSTESAVYCAVSLLMERWKAERRIDVFQTIRAIQQQRPETFTKLDEYIFCYQTVAESLEPAVR